MTTAPHPSVYILEEMAARGWSTTILALAMPGNSSANYAAMVVYLTIGPNDPSVRISKETAVALAQAFDVAPELFTNLERAWLRAHGAEL